MSSSEHAVVVGQVGIEVEVDADGAVRLSPDMEQLLRETQAARRGVGTTAVMLLAVQYRQRSPHGSRATSNRGLPQVPTGTLKGGWTRATHFFVSAGPDGAARRR